MAISGNKLRKKTVLTLVLSLLLGSFVMLTVVDFSDWIVGALIQPTFSKPETSLSPKKWGIAYQNVELQTSDNVTIKGWFLKNPKSGGKTIILCHGLGDSRWGALGTGVGLYQSGNYNIFLFDFRRHGLSQKTYFTFGYYEKQELLAIENYLVKEVGKDVAIGILGWSAGASIALQSIPLMSNVHGVIAINPFATLREAIYHRSPFFIPKSTVERGIKKAEKLAKFRVDSTSPIQSIKRAKLPVFLMVGDKDRIIPPAHSYQLHAANKRYTTLWTLQGYCHNNWWKHPQFFAKVLTFFQKSLKTKRK